MKHDIKLYDFFDRKVLAVSYQMIMEIPVPTECVITEPKFCVPSYARVFRTNLYLLRGDIVDWQDLSKEKDFRGTSHYDEVLLVEVWFDDGEDGHVCLNHAGYRYVPQSQFEKECKYPDPFHGGKMPECMRWYWRGWSYPVDNWEKNKAFKKEQESKENDDQEG